MRPSLRSEPSGAENFLALIIALILEVPGAIWIGFVGMKLWNWFVPVIFDGVPQLNLVQAIGLGLVVGFFTHQRQGDNGESALESVIASFFYALLYGGIMLLIGVVVSSFL